MKTKKRAATKSGAEPDIEFYKARYRHLMAQAELAFLVGVFGDELARRGSYPPGLDGVEAVHYYLCQKHHWLPAQARALNWEDLLFLLSDEMSGFQVPDAVLAVKQSEKKAFMEEV